MCHSSTRPGTSLYVTQFYQAFPRVNTASNKHWGEKAWVLLLQCLHHGKKIYYLCIIFSFLLMESHLIASVPTFKPLLANVVQLLLHVKQTKWLIQMKNDLCIGSVCLPPFLST